MPPDQRQIGPSPGGGDAAPMRLAGQDQPASREGRAEGGKQPGAGEPLRAQEQQPGGTGPGAPAPEPTDKNWASVAMAMVGFVALSMAVLRIYKRQRAAARQSTSSPGERLAEIRAEAAKNREPLEEVMADAVELSNRLAAQMDNRAERLDQLIAEANAAAERLERAAEGASGGRTSEPEAPPEPARVSHSPAPPPPRPVEGSPESVDRGHEEIYRLADEGLDAMEIARRTGQPRGQIELVLALRRT